MNKEIKKTHQEYRNPGYYIVGIHFRNNKTIYDFKSSIPLRVGDQCIVESKNNEEFGIVFSTKRNIAKGRVRRQFKKVLRKANEEDLAKVEKHRRLEKEARQIFNRVTEEKKLTIKLVSVSFSFNAQKAIVYFTSQERIEVKGLIKELADYFKVRIEMKQIGMRDAARLLGGCGLCGNKLCCASFLKEFKPVSIKMAKDQEIPLAPMKISGVCGRLLCCLVYEHATYKELRQGVPKCGQCVQTPEGEGKVIQRSILQEEISVKIEEGDNSGKILKFSSKEVSIAKKKNINQEQRNKPQRNKEQRNKPQRNKEQRNKLQGNKPQKNRGQGKSDDEKKNK